MSTWLRKTSMVKRVLGDFDYIPHVACQSYWTCCPEFTLFLLLHTLWEHSLLTAPSLFHFHCTTPMALATAHARLMDLLEFIASSLPASSKLSPRPINKVYKIVDSESDDEQAEEARALKSSNCPHCDGEPKRSTTRPRDGRIAYLTYSGWASSVLLTIVLAWVIWYQDHGLKSRCFQEVSSYCT